MFSGLSKHRDSSGASAKFSRWSYGRFTHVLVMDHTNLADARAIVPEDAVCQPQLLLDLVPGREGAAVADPYYGGEEHFEDTWADVSRAAAALVQALRR